VSTAVTIVSQMKYIFPDGVLPVELLPIQREGLRACISQIYMIRPMFSGRTFLFLYFPSAQERCIGTWLLFRPMHADLCGRTVFPFLSLDIPRPIISFRNSSFFPIYHTSSLVHMCGARHILSPKWSLFTAEFNHLHLRGQIIKSMFMSCLCPHGPRSEV